MPPAAIKAKNICRELLRNKNIKRFRIVASIPAAKIVDRNGRNKFLNLDELCKMQDGEYGVRGHYNVTPRNRTNNRQNEIFGTPTNGT